jgi:phage head maturation protease
MAKHFEKKIINCKALDIDTKKKSVKIAIGETESIDRDKDIIVPTAAVKTMKERGPEGTNEIWHLLDHTPKSFSALSKFSEMSMTGKYISGVSMYKDSFAWREVAWPLYESGDFTQHSIGFEVVKSQDRKGYREIQEITLYEGSAVLWGANPHTPTLAVMKSLGIDPAKDDLISRIERLAKGLKTGQYEDDSHKSLIIIELQQIKQDVFDIVNSTEPELKATLPDDIKDAFTIFKSQLILK